MRIDVEKVLIVAPMSSKEHFYREAQALGIIEFIRPHVQPLERPREIESLIEAIHILKRQKKTTSRFEPPAYDAASLASKIVESYAALEREQEKKRHLEKEVARIEAFGHFSMGDITNLERDSHRRLRFFFGKPELAAQSEAYEDLIKVSSHLGLDYYIALSHDNNPYPPFIEMKIDRSLSELHSELGFVQIKIDELQDILLRLAPYLRYLQQGLAAELNRFHLKEADQTAFESMEGHLFYAEGWVPKNKLTLLDSLSEKVSLYWAVVPRQADEAVPTYIENKGIARAGEDLINVYDTPSTSDYDPSSWVLFAFTLFFSMIISDAGYGLILLAISLYFRAKLKQKSRANQNVSKNTLAFRIVQLSTFLSIGCIVWGVLAASYFGINFNPDSHVKKISIADELARRKAEYLIKTKSDVYEHYVVEYPALADKTEPVDFLMAVKKEDGLYPVYEDFLNKALMELVLFLGAVHIFLGLLRYVKKSWANVGWALAIVGGYLYIPTYIHANSLIYYVFGVVPAIGKVVGLYLLFGGMALACLLAAIQKRWAALVEPMQVIQVFADIMSYLRIYALSLAGMIMAVTFNKMGMKLPWYVGMWIILAGHGINFTLAIIGGIIHGLRLNFIEWYHYSFEGGGKPFRPLEKIELE